MRFNSALKHAAAFARPARAASSAEGTGNVFFARAGDGVLTAAILPLFPAPSECISDEEEMEIENRDDGEDEWDTLPPAGLQEERWGPDNGGDP